MSAIDRVKELLAAAETECIGAVPCRRCDARTKLEARVHAIAEELVASQEALTLLLERIDEGHLVATEDTAARQSEGMARAALHLKKLGAVMEEK